MFRKIDNWLFDKVFQPITNKFAARTGRSNYWLSGTCVTFYAAVILTQAILLPTSDQWFFTLFLVVLTLLWAHDSDKADKNIKPSNTRNPKRISVGFTFLRGFVLIGVLIYLWLLITRGVNTQTTLDSLRAISFLSTVYFECCDTLPPPPPKPKTEVRVAPAA